MARRNGARARRSGLLDAQQSALLHAVDPDEHLDIPALETWLWDAACAVRGAADAPKFKDFILPLVFFKRLSDVFDDRFAEQVEMFGDEEAAWEVVRHDHEDALKTGRAPITGFYVPQEYNWRAIRHRPADGGLGEFVTTAMREVAKLNPELDGVVNVRDFNETQAGQRTLADDRLSALIEVINRHRLGLHNAEPDILGRAYEYLLRKFAEGQGQSAGEFYTPLRSCLADGPVDRCAPRQRGLRPRLRLGGSVDKDPPRLQTKSTRRMRASRSYSARSSTRRLSPWPR